MKTAEDIFKEHEIRDTVHKYDLIMLSRKELTEILKPYQDEIIELRARLEV